MIFDAADNVDFGRQKPLPGKGIAQSNAFSAEKSKARFHPSGAGHVDAQ